MSLEDLEKRVKVLEDIEEIKKLKRRYCGLSDDHYDADALAELFPLDGLWAGGVGGSNQGRQPNGKFSRMRPAVCPSPFIWS